MLLIEYNYDNKNAWLAKKLFGHMIKFSIHRYVHSVSPDQSEVELFHFLPKKMEYKKS